MPALLCSMGGAALLLTATLSFLGSSQLGAFLGTVWGFVCLWCNAVSSKVLCAVQSVFKEFPPVFRFGLMLVESSKVGGTNAHGNEMLILGQTIYITIVLNNWGSGSMRGH